MVSLLNLLNSYAELHLPTISYKNNDCNHSVTKSCREICYNKKSRKQAKSTISVKVVAL
jgi:hypothetical protein